MFKRLRLRSLLLLPLVAALSWPSQAHASGGDSHFVHGLLALTIALLASRLAGHLAVLVRQPAVLGELLAGVLIGNLALVGYHGLDWIRHDPTLTVLAELGVVLLLFEVGLESTVAEMTKVGYSAMAVAVLGVVAPFGLGWGVGAVLLPEHGWYVPMFLGAALTATSVGITARVLKDLGRSDSNEARIILGAAVIDDVLGLIILAVVGAIIAAADAGIAPELGPVVWILVKAALFLGGSVGLGILLTPWTYRLASRLRGTAVLLGISLAFCFGLSWLAAVAGLAPIVGAFAAGLVLEGAVWEPFVQKGEKELDDLVHPLVAFLSPVFFVLMGMNVELSTFADSSVLTLAAALTFMAILGKQTASLGVRTPGVSRLAVGIGMVPRGEVGLIFANIGLGLKVAGVPVLDAGIYSAIVVMVIVTTLITPPALTWSLQRADARRE